MQWYGKFIVIISVLISMAGIANAEFYVCGDASHFVQSFFRDPSFARPSNCSQVPDDLVEAQLGIVGSVPLRYLKVVPVAPNGLAVEMTASEKQAVDDAITAANTAANALIAEAATNPACNNVTLAQVDAFLDARMVNITASIDAISTVNLNTFKNALKAVMDEVDFRDRKIIRCLAAKLRR
jgi:hypothetical protein